MPTERKVGATADSEHLAQAMRANADINEIMIRQADTIARQPALYGPMLRLSALLREQQHHLMEMLIIRERGRSRSK
jgi:hypothetical protein